MRERRVPIWLWFLIGLILGAAAGWIIGAGRGLPRSLNIGHTLAFAMFGSLLFAGLAVFVQVVVARLRELTNR